VTGPAPQAPGAVRVRLTRGQDDTAALASLLAAVPGLEVLIGPDGPYPNRRPPGHRLSLTVRLTPPPPPAPIRWKDTPMSTDPATTADPAAETAGPDAPIPYTLTPLAETSLDGPGPAEPETDAEFLGFGPDGSEEFRVSWRDPEPEADL
jgi:hypothetical protein